MSNTSRPSSIATAVGVLALVLPVSALTWFFPEEMYKAFIYLGGNVFIIAFRESKALRRFVFAVLAFPLGVFLLVMFNRSAPGYAAPLSMLGAVCLLAWFVFSTTLTAAEKQSIASFLMRVLGAVLLLIVLLPMFARGGALAALAVWIVNGVLLVWNAMVGEWPLSIAPRLLPDAWRWYRDKDGTWRA